MWNTCTGSVFCSVFTDSKAMPVQGVSAALWSRLKQHAGIFYGIGGTAMLTLTDFGVKYLSDRQSVGQIMFCRYYVHTLLSILLLFALNIPFTVEKTEMRYLFVNVPAAAIAMHLLFQSFVLLPFVDATVIFTGLNNVLSSLIARIWLKERVSLYQVLVSCLLIAGVVIISKPTFIFHSSLASLNCFNYTKGVAVVAISASMEAVFTCTSRKIEKTSAAVISVYMGLACTVLGTAYMFIDRKFVLNQSAFDIVLLLFISIASVLGEYIWTVGLQNCNVMEFVAGTTFNIPFGVILQVSVFHLVPDYLSFIGCVLVFVCLLLLVLSEVLPSLMQQCSNRLTNSLTKQSE